MKLKFWKGAKNSPKNSNENTHVGTNKNEKNESVKFYIQSDKLFEGIEYKFGVKI
jgi:hypothetical protein